MVRIAQVCGPVQCFAMSVITSAGKKKPGAAGRCRVNGEIRSRLCREPVGRLIAGFSDRGRECVLIHARKYVEYGARVARNVDLQLRQAFSRLYRRVDRRRAGPVELLCQALAGTAHVGAVRLRLHIAVSIASCGRTGSRAHVKISFFDVLMCRNFVVCDGDRHVSVPISSNYWRFLAFFPWLYIPKQVPCHGTHRAIRRLRSLTRHLETVDR